MGKRPFLKPQTPRSPAAHAKAPWGGGGLVSGSAWGRGQHFDIPCFWAGEPGKGCPWGGCQDIRLRPLGLRNPQYLLISRFLRLG